MRQTPQIGMGEKCDTCVVAVLCVVCSKWERECGGVPKKWYMVPEGVAPWDRSRV